MNTINNKKCAVAYEAAEVIVALHTFQVKHENDTESNWLIRQNAMEM